MNSKKYFIAIVIPGALFEEIEAVKQALYVEHNLKGALRSPAHITLHRPFEWKEEKESILIEKLRGFKFNKTYHVQLKGFDFFEPRVIYVDVLQNNLLYELHNELTAFAKKELRLFNEVEDKRGFHPHVTVAFRDLKKPKFYTLQEEFRFKKIEGSFEYTGFSLLKLEKKWEILEDFGH